MIADAKAPTLYFQFIGESDIDYYSLFSQCYASIFHLPVANPVEVTPSG